MHLVAVGEIPIDRDRDDSQALTASAWGLGEADLGAALPSAGQGVLTAVG